jgi:hypothetical protein
MPADWSIVEDFQDVFENEGAHWGALSGAHIFLQGALVLLAVGFLKH